MTTKKKKKLAREWARFVHIVMELSYFGSRDGNSTLGGL
jgi:hypothetical protein